MPRRHPVITGAGIICAAGHGLPAVWETVRSNRSALGPLTLFPSPRFAHHLVGQVRQDLDGLASGVRGSRSDQLAWIATREAMTSAALTRINPDRTALLLGATVGGMAGTERVLTALLRDNQRRFGPLRFHECASAADLCARHIGVRGPVATVSTACSAGAMAILAATELIEQDEADVVLAGASDSLARMTLNGFGSLLLLDPAGCRPFDARRAGISLGEGAAVLVLEAEDTARAREARILARLSGWGASCDAFHATAPQPEGLGALEAMRRALERASVEPGEIDFVSAHGTATPDNDAMEARALKRLFGERVPPFGSVKRFFGHTLAASGAIKAVLAVQSLQEQAVPGTPGFEISDDDLGLVPVREFTRQRVQRVLSNSFGFGGNNVALIFSGPSCTRQVPRATRALDLRSTEPPEPKWHPVLGAGVIAPAGTNGREIAAVFHRGGAFMKTVAVPAISPTAVTKVYACGELGAEGLIEPAKRRRLSRLQQMTLVAAHQCLRANRAAFASGAQVCTVVGTGLGALTDTAAFVENMIVKEERAPRPSFFANSVHNSLAAQVAMEFGFSGLNSTPVHHGISFELALWQGSTELAAHRATLALVGAADELHPYHLAAGMRWGLWSDASKEIRPFTHPLPGRIQPPRGEGAALFSLGQADLASQPLAFVSSIRVGRRDGDSAEAEADWMCETLLRDGVRACDLDGLLVGANGVKATDDWYRSVADALSRRAGRDLPCHAYKHCCGEHHSASAFGFFVAIGMVRGEFGPELACRNLVLLTLSDAGSKGMCCVHAPPTTTSSSLSPL